MSTNPSTAAIFSRTGYHTQTLTLTPERAIVEIILDDILRKAKASVSIINRDHQNGSFLVQDLVMEHSNVKVSIDFSNEGLTCPIVTTGPQGTETRSTFEHISKLVESARENREVARQQLPEKLTRQCVADTTDGSMHFVVDIDETYLNPPITHRTLETTNNVGNSTVRRAVDYGLEDIRQHVTDANEVYSGNVSSDNENDDISISSSEQSFGPDPAPKYDSINLNKSVLSVMSLENNNIMQKKEENKDNFIEKSKKCTDTLLPRQHGGAKISSHLLSKVLAKLKAHSYELGGVNMTAEFQRVDKRNVGFLSRTDFGQALKRLVRLQKHELECVFELFDSNGNDLIEYREFVQFVLQRGESAAKQIARRENFNRAQTRSRSSSSIIDGRTSVSKMSEHENFFDELYRNHSEIRDVENSELFVKGFSLGIPPSGKHENQFEDNDNCDDVTDNNDNYDNHDEDNSSLIGTNYELKRNVNHHDHQHVHQVVNDGQLNWLMKNVNKLSKELEQLKQQTKRKEQIYDAGQKELQMTQQLTVDLRKKLYEALQEQTQNKNKNYQSEQIIERLTKNVETSKILLSRVHEQCEVWKEQAEVSQKNLEILKLRSSEEIEELRKTLQEANDSWKKKENIFELEKLRLKDESVALGREKNAEIADLQNQIMDIVNKYKDELRQVHERLNLSKQKLGSSEEAWKTKTHKLVSQSQDNVDKARADADQRLADLTVQKTRTADALQRITELEERIVELEVELKDAASEHAKRYNKLEKSSQQVINSMKGKKKVQNKKIWSLLSQSATLRGFVNVPTASTSDTDDDEDPIPHMLEAMQKNVAEVERTKLSMSNIETENEILRQRCSQLELQYGMQAASIRALRLATMAAKMREKESVKRSCVAHVQLKDAQLSIEKFSAELQHYKQNASLYVS